MAYRLGVLRGDGIGPKIVEATIRVLEAAQQRDSRLRFEWVPLPDRMGGDPEVWGCHARVHSGRP